MANYCADRLHQTLAEETLSSFAVERGADNGEWENRWKKAMTSCFLRMDAEVGGVSGRDCDCGQAEGCSKCSIEPIAPETVGTTAIVAVVGSCQIIVGNCGDSRAVLSRGGVAVPLSVDHKVCCFFRFETCVTAFTAIFLFLFIIRMNRHLIYAHQSCSLNVKMKWRE